MDCIYEKGPGILGPVFLEVERRIQNFSLGKIEYKGYVRREEFYMRRFMKRFLFCFLFGTAVMAYGAATRNDWKVFPMTESKAQIPLNLFYTKQEFASIAQGFIPRDMDDRWVMIVEDGHILFYRSWTGIMIYDCSFEEKENGIRIGSMYVNRNIEEYKNTDDQHDVRMVESWLNWLAQK